MALSSQSGHSTGGRSYMSSRRRRGKRWPSLLFLMLICVGVWYFWFRADDPVEVDNGVVAGGQAVVVEDEPVAEAERRVIESVVDDEVEVVEPEQLEVVEPVGEEVQRAIEEVEVAIADSSKPEADSSQQVSSISGSDLMAEAGGLVQAGKFVEARQLLSDAIFEDSDIRSPTELAAARELASEINDTLVFSKRIVPGDSLVTTYVIEPNDALSRIAPTYKTPYQFITLINGISNPNRIRVGQRLKVVKGPFHAIVDKSDFRLDVYVIAPDGRRVFMKSFPVGLGEDDTTPIGQWAVRNGSKLENPRWTNPATGKSYGAGAADHPIGKYWLVIRGTDEVTKDLSGYGIHGTVDVTSIGRMASMGCVRMGADDIKLLYNLLVERHSTVEIRR